MIDMDRVKAILLKPGDEWPRIAGEQSTVASISKDYLLWLIAASVIASFLNRVLGHGPMATGFSLSIGLAIVQAALAFAGIFVMSWVISALAPSFGGIADRVAAFKLLAYASTASLLGSILIVLPLSGILSFVAGIYSMVLLYKGLPILMKSRQARSPIYMLVIFVCAVVVGIVLSLFTSLLVPAAAVHDDMMKTQQHQQSFKASPADRSNTATTVKGDDPQTSQPGYTQRLETATQKLEKAQQTGDAQRIAKAAQGSLAALFGADKDGRQAISIDKLKAFTPTKLSAFSRIEFESGTQNTLGFAINELNAKYRNGDKVLTVKIIDVGGGTGALMNAVSNWTQNASEKETERYAQRHYQQGGRKIAQKEFKDGSRAEFSQRFENGIVVDATGTNMSLAELKTAIDFIDIDALETAQ